MPARLLALLLAVALLGACSNKPVQTQLPDGRLQGYIDEGVEHYLGIPYAQPPVGELRWRPPQPAAAWDGLLNAQDNPGACAQFIPLRKSLVGSEDCLYLNVWTPMEKPDQPMPVMVWLHGGGFVVGKGSFSAEEGALLAGNNQVVVVSINYRLGVMGFLAHEALSAEDPEHPGSGNYGIQDQTAALRWVRDNISTFGGDPDNVTIFGQSAGGVSVCAQMVSPQARGLFHRAVIQSGPCATPLPILEAVSKLGERVAAAVSCDDDNQQTPARLLACLRAKPAQEVADVLAPDPSFNFDQASMVWWPNLDQQVLPLQFMEAFESGRFNQVPVINGATRDEASLLIWITHNMMFRPLRADQYQSRLEFLAGSPELAQAVAEHYPLQQYPSPFEALTAAFSDGFFNCISRWQALAISRHVPTWSYQFDYDQAPFFVPWADLKAFHSAEIQYVFGRPMRITGGNFSAAETDLASSMMGYWVQFARRGDPNGGAPGYWPPYGSDDKTLLFNLQNSVATAVHEPECRFWEELDYLKPIHQ